MSIDLKRALPYLSPALSAEDTAPVHAFGSADAPIVRRFSSSMNLTYIMDEPGALVFIRERDVQDHDRDGLHTRALENLRARIQQKRLRFELLGVAHRARLDGHLDASLLLLDELWDPPTRVHDPDGELVAAVPARNTLVIAGSSAPGAVDELRVHTARITLSSELFVRRNRAWQPFGAD